MVRRGVARLSDASGPERRLAAFLAERRDAGPAEMDARVAVVPSGELPLAFVPLVRCPELQPLDERSPERRVEPGAVPEAHPAVLAVSPWALPVEQVLHPVPLDESESQAVAGLLLQLAQFRVGLVERRLPEQQELLDARAQMARSALLQVLRSAQP